MKSGSDWLKNLFKNIPFLCCYWFSLTSTKSSENQQLIWSSDSFFDIWAGKKWDGKKIGTKSVKNQKSCFTLYAFFTFLNQSFKKNSFSAFFFWHLLKINILIDKITIKMNLYTKMNKSLISGLISLPTIVYLHTQVFFSLKLWKLRLRV